MLSSNRSALTCVVGALAAAPLVWGLHRYGATSPVMLYEVFLLALPVGVLVSITLAPELFGEWRHRILLWVGLYLLTRVAVHGSLQGRGYMLAACGWLCFLFAFWLVTRSRLAPWRIALFLIAVGAVETAYGMVQAVGGVDYIGNYFRGKGRLASGTLIHPNHYAGLLNLLWPLAVGWVFAGFIERRRRREEAGAIAWIGMLACALCGFAVLLSRSRGGVVSLAATAGLLIILVWRRRGRSVGVPVVAGVILLALVTGAGLSMGMAAFVSSFAEIPADDRLAIYTDSAKLVADHPLVGVGPGMYAWRIQPYQTANVNRHYVHAHNDYLELAADWGLPLAVAFWCFVGWRGYRSGRIFLAGGDPRRQGLALGVCGSIFSIAFHGLFDFNLHIPANLMVFCTVLALSWAVDPPVPAGGRHRPHAWLARLAIPLVLVVCAWQAGNQFLARRAFWSAGSAADLEAALARDASDPAYHHGLARELRDVPWSVDVATAREHLEQADRLNPWDRLQKLDLSRAHEILGDRQAAGRLLAEAAALRPRTGDSHWQLANFRLRGGDRDAALAAFGEAMGAEAKLIEPALPLLFRAGYSVAEIESVLPESPTAARALLQEVAGEDGGRPRAAAEQVEPRLWQRMVAAHPPPKVDWYYFYLKHLLAGGRAAQARREWRALWATRGVVDELYDSGAEGLWNSDFNRPLAGTGLGWKALRSDHHETSHTGSALEVRFLGSENLDFRDLRQDTVLVPGARYRLEADFETTGITTDEGVYFEVVDVRDGRVIVATGAATGDSKRALIGRDFDSPDGDGRVQVRLRRRPSRRLDNELAGTVRIHAVRARSVER